MVAMTQNSDGWICLEGSGRQRANGPSFLVMLFVGYINTCAVYFAGSLALGHAEYPNSGRMTIRYEGSQGFVCCQPLRSSSAEVTISGLLFKDRSCSGGCQRGLPCLVIPEPPGTFSGPEPTG